MKSIHLCGVLVVEPSTAPWAPCGLLENGHQGAQGDSGHRGGLCDADGKTGDGAGIHVRSPSTFYDQVRAPVTAPAGRAKIDRRRQGLFDRAPTFAAQETCRTIRFETKCLRMGYYIYGWRHVAL